MVRVWKEENNVCKQRLWVNSISQFIFEELIPDFVEAHSFEYDFRDKDTFSALYYLHQSENMKNIIN